LHQQIKIFKIAEKRQNTLSILYRYISVKL